MLTREWGAESNEMLPHLFISSKTAAFVHEFAVEDLPRQNAALVLALGRTMIYICLYIL